jgi:hypothetical protein
LDWKEIPSQCQAKGYHQFGQGQDVVNLDHMKIYVKDWKGKTFTIDVVDPNNKTVEDVKKNIQDREGIPVNEQILKFDGKNTPNYSRMSHHTISQFEI